MATGYEVKYYNTIGNELPRIADSLERIAASFERVADTLDRLIDQKVHPDSALPAPHTG